jgi:hypothetical protein
MSGVLHRRIRTLCLSCTRACMRHPRPTPFRAAAASSVLLLRRQRHAASAHAACPYRVIAPPAPAPAPAPTAGEGQAARSYPPHPLTMNLHQHQKASFRAITPRPKFTMHVPQEARSGGAGGLDGRRMNRLQQSLVTEVRQAGTAGGSPPASHTAARTAAEPPKGGARMGGAEAGTCPA